MKEQFRAIDGGARELPPLTLPAARADREPLVDVANPRHREALEKLEQGVEMAMSDDGFRRYLNVVAKLHRYSPRNVMLIFAQRPDAAMVASYRKWRELGRQVQKGEQGLKVFYPLIRKELDPETGAEEERVVGFGLGNVFDVSQTQGEEIPQPPRPDEDLGTAPGTTVFDRKASLWALGEGIRLEKVGISGARGRWNPVYKKIAINENLPDDVARLKTLLHEMAHWQAGHDGLGLHDLGLEEVVSEGTAYAAMRALGFDTGAYSHPYVLRFSDRREAIREAMPQIARLTRIIVEKVEGEKPDGEEEWM